jgi:negative regulator of replication initiation
VEKHSRFAGGLKSESPRVETTGVIQLQLEHMAKCLEVAFKANIPKPQRRRVVAKTADWTMLEKPWRSLVYIAMEEIEPPGDDEDKPSMSRQHRGSRRRTRGGGAQTPLDWLPSLEEIVLDTDSSEVFRLAVMLVNKQLKKDDWKDEYNSDEQALREYCLENGVEATWHKLAENTSLLGQFLAFPISKKKQKKSTKKTDISKARIDINDSEKVLELLNEFSPLCEDAETQVALQKVISQIKSKRVVSPSKQLLDLKGTASIISVLITLTSGKDSTKAVKELNKADSKLASEFADLSSLMNGEVKGWKASITVDSDDGLSHLRRYLAWQLTPLEDATKLSSGELSDGIELLSNNSENNSKIEQLTWIYLSALNNEGSTEEAKQLLLEQTLDQNADLTELMPVISSLNSPDIYQWLESQIPNLDEASLIEIIKVQDLSNKILKLALNRLQDQNSEAWDEVVESAVEIYSQTLELNRLAKLFSSNPVLVLAHPYEALLVYHLIAANGDSELLATAENTRSEGLSSIHGTHPPEYLSSTSHSLLLMMEGSSVDEDSFTILDKRGYQALKSARNSLKEGGSGTISLTNLDHLIASVEQSDLDELETRLFSVLISTLRLNYVRLTLQHGVRSKDNVRILSKLVEGENIPSRIINSLSQLIFEHDIGLPSLVSWYQDNDPLSPWHTVSRAAVSAQNNDEINAARDYRRAAEHNEFDFEHSMILYRKALIHLAHAGQWSEAVNLLEQQPALKTAITQRFQLYLNVSYTANNKSTDKATQMLKNFVRRTRVVNEENEEGEMIERERVYFAEDELDALRSYPFEHRRTLPHDPFSGRVTAAITTVQKSRRRNRKSFDMQFMTIMQQSSPLPIEVYDLAKEAAENNPIEGLMFFERAQNSGKFSLRDSKTLADAETSLFAKYKLQITNSSRRFLKHLSLPPLVIVDTNILIDALVEKISSQLELASETSLDLSELNSFHKVLISRARDGKISMWLPQIVRHELQEIGKGVSKLRDKFKNSLVRPEILDKVLTQENLEKLTEEVIEDFNQWKPLDIRLEEDSDSVENKQEIKKFLQDYHDIYDELSAMKKAHGGKQKRTKIDGKAIYPEAPDRVIMAIAIHLGNQSLEGLGTVLVATRDGDFTLTARAFEERFGFGVVKNSRMLNAWLEI